MKKLILLLSLFTLLSIPAIAQDTLHGLSWGDSMETVDALFPLSQTYGNVIEDLEGDLLMAHYPKTTERAFKYTFLFTNDRLVAMEVRFTQGTTPRRWKEVYSLFTKAWGTPTDTDVSSISLLGNIIPEYGYLWRTSSTRAILTSIGENHSGMAYATFVSKASLDALEAME